MNETVFGSFKTDVGTMIGVEVGDGTGVDVKVGDGIGVLVGVGLSVGVGTGVTAPQLVVPATIKIIMIVTKKL